MRRLLLTLFIIILSKSLYASFALKPLDQADLTKLISGKTIYPAYAHLFLNEGESFQNDQAKMYFHKDGTIYVEFNPRMSTGLSTSIKKVTGNWSIDSNGKFCETWNPTFLSRTVEHCGYWYPMENVYLMVSDDDKVLMLLSKRKIENIFHLF